MKILLSVFFLNTFFIIGQSINTLESKGELPSFILENKTNFLVPQELNWIRIKPSKENLLQQIYATHSVVFGDAVSAYCSDLLFSVLNDKNRDVFVVKSSLARTFSNETDDLFITSGLIARCLNEKDLLFALIRETVISEEEIIYNKWNKTKYNDYSTLDIFIKKVTDFTLNTDITIDLKTLAIYSKFNNDGKKVLSNYYDVIQNERSPFAEEKIDWNYFNDEDIYFPINHFMKVESKHLEKYNPEIDFPEVKIRRDSLIKERKFETINKLDYSITRFNESIYLTRLDVIYQDILVSNFYYALYEIYVLEKTNKTNKTNKNEFDYLKAYCWYKIASQKLRVVKTYNYEEYFKSNNEGALFCKFIRVQSTEVLLTLTLKKLYELDNSQTNKLTLIENFANVLKLYGDFDLKKFQDVNYKTAYRNVKSEPVVIDTKLKEFNKSKLLDSMNFQDYFIPELINDSLFMAKLNTMLNDSTTKKITSYKEINNVIFSSNKSKFNDFKEQNDLLTNSTPNIVYDTVGYFSAEKYNQRSKYYYTINQGFNYNLYASTVESVFSNESNHGISSIIQYNHKVQLKLRPFNFLGLLIVTLPYVVPEFIYSSNMSVFSVFYFDEKGNIIKIVNRLAKDPCNKRIFKSYLLDSIEN